MTERIGFTGTRRGMTLAQRERVTRILEDWTPEIVDHGDCDGGDAQFHGLARMFVPGVRVIGHPPDDPRWRAFCDCDELEAERPYLERNEDIVNHVDVLIATPAQTYNVPRGSGTWYTIRYARRIQRRLLIVWPDGTVPGGEC